MSFRCAFTIRSDTRYLTPLRDWVAAVAKIIGHENFPNKAVIPCSLALVEAVDNAIFHAHDRRKDLPIHISLSLLNGKIVLEVTDSGCGIGHPELPKPDEFVTHGRGLFIIRNMMSEVTSTVADNKHHLRMIYRI